MEICDSSTYCKQKSSILLSVLTPFQKHGKGKYAPNHAFKYYMMEKQ